MKLDDKKLDIPCPQCSKKIVITVGQAKRSAEVTCISCGARTKIDAKKFVDTIRNIEKALGKLDGRLS